MARTFRSIRFIRWIGWLSCCAIRGRSLVVTTTRLAESFPAGEWRVIALDGDGEEIAAASGSALESGVRGDDLAYIIYTSGSTGQPKGVELIHSGLANLVAWHERAFQVTAADRASAQSALGFDAAVWEMWSYLAAGASLHLADDAVRNDAAGLRDWLVATKHHDLFRRDSDGGETATAGLAGRDGAALSADRRRHVENVSSGAAAVCAGE